MVSNKSSRKRSPWTTHTSGKLFLTSDCQDFSPTFQIQLRTRFNKINYCPLRYPNMSGDVREDMQQKGYDYLFLYEAQIEVKMFVFCTE